MTSQRVAYDTNILAYLEALARHADDQRKIASIRKLHRELASRCTCVVPQQALGEFYTLLVRTSGDREVARSRVLAFMDEFECVIPGNSVFPDALDLATEHKLQFWDALIVSTAASGGCSLILSEDMQDGFSWRGVTVTNPFADRPHRRLAQALK